MYTHILIPTDGSQLAEQAVTKGIELAGVFGARVTILTVVEPFHIVSYAVGGDAEQIEASVRSYEMQASAYAGGLLETAAAKASASGVAVDTLKVESDHPSEAIVKAAADRGADLIVMASNGRRGVAALVLGSQTQKVLTHTKIPVLVLR